MSDSSGEGSEVRMALRFVAAGIVGAILMALASNFLK
jgi:hypothetical protein